MYVAHKEGREIRQGHEQHEKKTNKQRIVGGREKLGKNINQFQVF